MAIIEAKNNKLRKAIYLDSIEYFRSHPDDFIEDVMNIKLNIYQKMLVRTFFRYDYNCWALGRGIGKTFLGMLCLCAYCLLYPGTKAGIIAPAFRQGKQAISEKYKQELCEMSPFLEQEESSYTCSTQKARIEFYNGSWIEAYPIGNDGARIRGARLHIVLVDEAAYVPKNIIDTVIKPMMVVRRGYQVGKDDSEYENNKILYASSASYRFNYLYTIFTEYVHEMIKPDNTQYFACNLPYTIGLHVGLFDEALVKQQSSQLTSMQFAMEYLAQFPKLAENAWINYDDIQACSDLDHVELKGVEGFEYVMSIDVARVEGHDNTIIDVFKLHWFSDHVEADLVYVVSMNGKTFSYQAKQVRDLLKKFPNVISIVQDTMTIGQGLSDELAKDYYDNAEQKWYPPLIDVNNEQQMKAYHSGSLKGTPIIFGIRANNELNHRMGYAVKNFTEKRWLHMYPMSVEEKRDLNSEEEKQVLEAEEARSEIINIETAGMSGGWLKFRPSSRGRKDRWSAMGMGLYRIQLIADERLNKETDMPMPIIGVRR